MGNNLEILKEKIKNNTALTKQIQEWTLNPIKAFTDPPKLANSGLIFFIVFFLKEYCFMVLVILLVFHCSQLSFR